MKHTITSGEAARQQRCSQRRGLDIERICIVLCKYAERLEAVGAETEQADAPTAATGSAAQSTVPVSDHRQILP